MKKKLLILLCACMMAAGCGQSAQTPAESQAPQQQEETQQAGSQGVKKLGVSSGRVIAPVELKNAWEKAAFFVDQVYAEKKESVLVSPLSLNLALGMTAEGSSGETATELYRYLGGENYADWVDQYITYAESLEKGEEPGVVRFGGYDFAFQMANSIWLQNGYELKEEYQELVSKKFRATAENVDFIGDGDATARKINSWCDENTKGLIKEIVNKDMFSSELITVLVNSVYFESPWADAWDLTQHEFTNASGEKKEYEMLEDTLSEYFENEYCTAFSKAYYNGFKFIGILPKQEGEFNLSDLDLESLMKSSTYDYDVHAICPKLAYETTADNIVDILKAEGVIKAFDDQNAEFGRLVKDQKLYISDILQKCRIELDENGTKAAAVTAVFMDKLSMVEPAKKTKDVILDRPFAYLIYDSNNDVVVFAGKVTDIQ